MRNMQKFAIISILTVFLFLTLSSVSAEVVVTGQNTTSQISNAINGYRDVVLEGEFRNLSTINIGSTNVKISGRNATIIRNSSNPSSSILFRNTAGSNLTIENLTIIGYDTAIYSTRYQLTIQNNKITTTQTAINITRDYNMRENKIINNSIQTTNGHGIYVKSKEDLKYNSFSGNNISTNGTSSHGIFIEADDGVFETNFLDNNIITRGNYSSGIYINFGSTYLRGNVSNCSFSRNNINATSGGFYICASNGITNNNFTHNNVTKQNNSNYGIFLQSNTLVHNNNVSNNIVKSNGVSSFGIFLLGNSGNVTNNYVLNNIINMNETSGIFSVGTNISNNDFSNNTITTQNPGSRGIFLNPSFATNNHFSNNIITTNGNYSEGIFIATNNNGFISNNAFLNNSIVTKGNYSYGIRLNTTNDINSNIITRNNITTEGNYTYGVNLETTTNIEDNTISRNNINTISDICYGLYMKSDSGINQNNNILYNNIITLGDSSYGIFLVGNKGTKYNKVSNNKIRINGNGGFGLFLNSNNITANNIVSNNDITTLGISGFGIFLYGGMNGTLNNVILNNTVNTNNISSFGIYLSSNIVNNSILNNTIITKHNDSFGILFDTANRNNSIIGNNLINNGTSIRISNMNSSGLNISYNRILTNDTFITLTNPGNNNRFFANWLGNNTPDMNKIINITMESYYVVNASAIKNNSIVGDEWIIGYTFYLNGTNNRGDYKKLPFFQSQLLDSSNNTIKNRNATDVGSWNIGIKHPEINTFSVVLDNEKIPLGTFTSQKGKTTISIDTKGRIGIGKTIKINGVLKNIQGKTLANKKVTLFVNGKAVKTQSTDENGYVSFTYTTKNSGKYTFQLVVDEDDDYNGTKSAKLTKSIVKPVPPQPQPEPKPTYNTKENANKSMASMKSTGIPVIAIILVLLASLGLIVRKK